MFCLTGVIDRNCFDSNRSEILTNGIGSSDIPFLKMNDNASVTVQEWDVQNPLWKSTTQADQSSKNFSRGTESLHKNQLSPFTHSTKTETGQTKEHTEVESVFGSASNLSTTISSKFWDNATFSPTKKPMSPAIVVTEGMVYVTIFSNLPVICSL